MDVLGQRGDIIPPTVSVISPYKPFENQPFIHHTSRWARPLVMSLNHRKGQFVKTDLNG